MPKNWTRMTKVAPGEVSSRIPRITRSCTKSEIAQTRAVAIFSHPSRRGWTFPRLTGSWSVPPREFEQQDCQLPLSWRTSLTSPPRPPGPQRGIHASAPRQVDSPDPAGPGAWRPLGVPETMVHRCATCLHTCRKWAILTVQWLGWARRSATLSGRCAPIGGTRFTPCGACACQGDGWRGGALV